MTSKIGNRKFLKPSDDLIRDEATLDLEEERTSFVYNPNNYLSLEEQRKKLPIHQQLKQIIYLTEKYQVLILVGETGCGKSTQVPQILPLKRDSENSSYLEDHFIVPCDISPLCDVTVKSMMLDHSNHYLFGPLATILDNILGIDNIVYITPNMISAFHVVVAIVSAKCIASDSLVTRRICVGLFEIRSFLDDMDGHVARARKNIHGDYSEVGSSGYIVDGLCDGLGVIALLIGCLVFLKNNPPRRGYVQLQTLIPQVLDVSKDPGTGMIYKGKVTSKKVMHKISCFGAQLLLGSTAWNRYIALYQDMLERKNVSPQQASLQIQVFRSSLMWTVSWFWRIINPHEMVDVMLIAIFCDKLWEFLRTVQCIGFIALLALICVTEMHLLKVQALIYKTLSGNGTSL